MGVDVKRTLPCGKLKLGLEGGLWLLVDAFGFDCGIFDTSSLRLCNGGGDIRDAASGVEEGCMSLTSSRLRLRRASLSASMTLRSRPSKLIEDNVVGFGVSSR